MREEGGVSHQHAVAYELYIQLYATPISWHLYHDYGSMDRPRYHHFRRYFHLIFIKPRTETLAGYRSRPALDSVILFQAEEPEQADP